MYATLISPGVFTNTKAGQHADVITTLSFFPSSTSLFAPVKQ